SPRKHEIVFAMDTGGNERTQLYLLHGVGGNTDHGIGDGWLIDDLSKNPKAIHGFGGWSHDGASIAFSANREEPSRFDVYVQSRASRERQRPEPRLVAKGPGGYYQPVGFAPDDKFVLVSRVESNFNQDLYTVEFATGTSKQITPHKDDVQYHSPSWSADGKFVYCTSTADGRDIAALARIDVATGKLTYLETPEHEVEHIVASPKGKWLAYCLNVGGQSELHLRDLKTDKTIAERGLPLGVIGQLEFAPDDSKLAFVVDGPKHNMDVWLWDLAAAPKGKGEGIRQLTHSSRAGVPF